MNAIYAFTHDHVHGSEDELTLQYLGIRMFNAGGASIKLALSGYYQKAFHHVRDVLETSFLVDYLSTYPEKIDKWRRADKKTRIVHFGPGVIRNALDKRDDCMSGERTRIYGLDLSVGVASDLFGYIADDQWSGEPGTRRTVLRSEEADSVAAGDGVASEPSSLGAHANSREQRPPASGYANALPQSAQRMVVEVSGVRHWEGPTLAVRTGKVLSAS